MIEKLQRRYALSEQGAKDLVKGCIACALQNISFMFPVSLLYILVTDLLNGGVRGTRIFLYVTGCVVCVGLILLTTWFQYNSTYFATYRESGVRRISLAEKLRKIPLSFFGKKGFGRPHQYYYGGLHLFRAELFTLYSGAIWIYCVYGSRGNWLACF